MKRICGIFVLGFAANFFWTSAEAPSKVTLPVVEYLAMFGFVVISRLKLSSTWLPLLFCSSILALMSKKRFSVGVIGVVLSACKLSMRIETMTPVTEYFGQIIDSPTLF